MARRLLSGVVGSLLIVQAWWSSSIGVSVVADVRSPNANLRIVGLRTEYNVNPLGIDSRRPRLSWQILSDARGVIQSAYQVRVAHDRNNLIG